jgi:hypothetical protein
VPKRGSVSEKSAPPPCEVDTEQALPARSGPVRIPPLLLPKIPKLDPEDELLCDRWKTGGFGDDDKGAQG